MPVKPPKRSQPAANSAQTQKEVLLGKARQYVLNRESAKKLAAEQAKLSATLKEGAATLGDRDGDSFHLLLGDIKVSQLAAVSHKVDQAEAIKILEDLDLLERCTTRVLNEQELEVVFQEGLIGIDEINSFTKEVISNRIDVRIV